MWVRFAVDNTHAYSDDTGGKHNSMSDSIKITLPRPHQKQGEMLRESRRYNVAVCGRRFGKTIMAADILIDGPRRKGALHSLPVALYAPTYSTMLESWRRFTHILAPITASRSEQNKRIDLITGGVIEMWSLDNPDAGRGRKYATIVIDEAAMVRRLEEAWTQNIQPLLMDYEGEAWFVSTPKGDNYFKTLYERGNPANPQREEDWQSWQLPTWFNPYIAKAEIEKMRESMPRLAFLQEICAEFVTFAGTFVKAEHIRSGQAPEGLTLYTGVDLAISMKENADYTAVVTVGIDDEGRVWIVDAERRRVGFRDALEFIKEKATRWRPVSIAIEAVQYQAAVVEELLRSTDLPVCQVKPDKDKLTRAQGLITRYENGLVWHDERLPRYFVDEVLAFGPDCEHDDLVDAAVYAYMQTGDYGRTSIYLGGEGAPNVLIRRVEAEMPGLPPAVVQLFASQEEVCCRCACFEMGVCSERGFLVGESDPACPMFSGREELE